MDHESLLMEMVRQSTRNEQIERHTRRPRLDERRRRFRIGPRVEPEARVAGDPNLQSKDSGLLAAFRKLIGRR